MPQAGKRIKGACSAFFEALLMFAFVLFSQVCTQQTASAIGCSQYFSERDYDTNLIAEFLLSFCGFGASHKPASICAASKSTNTAFAIGFPNRNP